MLLVLVVAIGAVLRFYNLMWGNGYFFDPDEGNMASSISQMTPEKAFHPNFFAYGQFPLYLSYFSAQLANIIKFIVTFSPTTDHRQLIALVPYPDAIFWLRFWSAAASTVTILLVYQIVKVIIGQKDRHESTNKHHYQFFSLSAKGTLIPLAAAFLTAVMPGLIQSAHLGTTESLLTFFFMLSIYLSLKILTGGTIFRYTVLSGIAVGLGLGTKITAALFFVPPGIALLYRIFSMHGRFLRKAGLFIGFTLILVLTALVFFFCSSPHTVLDFKDFKGTTLYETEVATGKAQVFYTRQFINTIPFVFQVTHIFPYALGWGMMLVGIASIVCLPIIVSRKKDSLLHIQYLILTASFALFLISNAILFVKWTRFSTPIFPFFPIFIGFFFFFINKNNNHWIKKTGIVVLGLTLAASLVQGIAFFSIYARDDVRYTASQWVYQHIPKGSYLLFDTGNVVDIPFLIKDKTNNSEMYAPAFNYKLVSFDFYSLDRKDVEDPGKLSRELVQHLEKADYILVPSRRIFSNHLRLPDQYPMASAYYINLFNGTLGFTKVAQIDSFPKIAGITFPDEQAEETWTVFDHPVVRVYKKTEQKIKEEYQSLLDTSSK